MGGEQHGPHVPEPFHNKDGGVRTGEVGALSPRLSPAVPTLRPTKPLWLSPCASRDQGLEWKLLKAPLGLHFQREGGMIHIFFCSPLNPQHVKYEKSIGYVVGAQ